MNATLTTQQREWLREMYSVQTRQAQRNAAWEHNPDPVAVKHRAAEAMWHTVTHTFAKFAIEDDRYGMEFALPVVRVAHRYLDLCYRTYIDAPVGVSS